MGPQCTTSFAALLYSSLHHMSYINVLARGSLASASSLQPALTTSARATGGAAQAASFFTSSSSHASSSRRVGELPAPVDWNWRWVLGKQSGRRPAIKNPARHQWYFCNPNYDPHTKPPRKLLTPFAPPTAQYLDDWAAYQRTKQSSDPEHVWRHRRDFVHYLKLREVDWRTAFQQGLSAEVKAAQKQQKLSQEARRQLAWRRYRDAMFVRARDSQEQAQ